jgi:hypothetical protein
MTSRKMEECAPLWGGTAMSLTTDAELAAVKRPYYLADMSAATVDISYSAHVSQGSR